jgi:hypothetical protein
VPAALKKRKGYTDKKLRLLPSADEDGTTPQGVNTMRYRTIVPGEALQTGKG